MSNGNFWLQMIIEYANDLMQEEGVVPACNMDEKTEEAWSKAMNFVKKMSKLKKGLLGFLL